MAESNLTLEVVRALFAYDKTTGIITNKVDRSRRDAAGSNAGCKKPNGYVSIKIFGDPYQAHRVAWMHVNGRWPMNEIDHINGVRDDNRIENLREATTAENCQNRKTRSDNRSGFTGVRKHQGRYRADIKINGSYKFIGSYETPERAHDAYLHAKTQLHTFNPIPR